MFFVLLYSILNLGYVQQIRAQDELKAQINQMQSVLLKPREDLSELEAKSRALQATIPINLYETDVYPVIRHAAARNNLLLTNQSRLPPAFDQIGKTRYKLMKFNLTATGSYNHIQAFVDDLATHEDLPTLVLRSATVERGTESKSRVHLGYDIYVRVTE